MGRQILIIEVAVGYLLKVIKSGKKNSKYKEEFAAIRHGDYYTFINLVGGQLPLLVTYNSGNVYIDDKNNENDIDFAGLLKAGNSLKIFYENCFEHYGHVIDTDLSDKLYCELVYFEISLRMHANNHNLLTKPESLENIIDKLCNHLNLTEEEKIALHDGRRFLNMVKHPKRQFETWTLGIKAFSQAKKILEKHQLTIL